MFSKSLWKYNFGLLQVSYKYTNNKFGRRNIFVSIQLRVSVNF